MVAKRLEGIGEYYFAHKLRELDALRKEGKHIINLGIGSPDLPPHPDVISTLQQEAARPGVHGYQSYKGTPVLRDAFARWYQQVYHVALDPEQEVLPLIGSKEGIMHICMTYLDAGDKVLVPDPGYPAYTAAVKLAGAEPVYYRLTEERGWLPDWEELEQNHNGDIKMMFLNYPNMPTGKCATVDDFSRFVAFAKTHNILLVHDNPYSFILNEQPTSILSVPGARDVAIELNSLSKSHNMPGWRVGVLCGNSERINEVLRFKSNMDSGMFLPLQLAAATALDLGDDWYKGINNIYAERKAKALALLAVMGCRCLPGQAGLFVWARVPGGYADGYALSDVILYECGIFVTPGGIFGAGGANYIRISLCADVALLEEATSRIAATKMVKEMQIVAL